jgi:hypothetical protein
MAGKNRGDDSRFSLTSSAAFGFWPFTSTEASMKKLSLAFLIWIAAACGKVSLDAPEPTNGPLFSKDVTDRSVCQNPTPPIANIFANGWTADFLGADGTTYNKTIFISHNTISSLLICSRGNHSVVARAQANLAVNYTQLQILSSSADEKTLDDGQTKTACRAEFSTGHNFQYSFVGPCLNIQSENESADQSVTYVPSR